MRRIVLMPEYSGPPLWTDKGPVTPEELGLSKELSDRIRAWADEWEHGGGQESTEEEFVARGESLAREIRDELGSSATVVYES